MRKLSFFFFVFHSLQAFAFLPPVASMLREVTEGRKAGPIEVVLRHRISVRGSGAIEVEERIVNERNRYSFLWSGSAFPRGLAGTLERYQYIVGDNAIPSRSAAWVTYLAGLGGDSLRDVLVNEQFVRRDQLLQYKPGWSPTGDPQTWELRENYLRHADVVLRRIAGGVAIAVIGMEEGAVAKTLYVDKNLKGLRRLEWKDGQEINAWNFESFGAMPAGGQFPRRITFETGGAEVITTDLVAARSLNAKALSDFKNSWKQAPREPASSNGEGVLKLLLSFR